MPWLLFKKNLFVAAVAVMLASPANPCSYGVNCWLLEPCWSVRWITAKLCWEQLGGNGVPALQTPLATLHAFNGWDDQFLTTPAGGLADRYLAVSGKFTPGVLAKRLAWAVGYRDDHAVTGGEYGREGDASLGVPLGGGVKALVKVAHDHANGFGHDDTKVWLQAARKLVRRRTGQRSEWWPAVPT